jgi:hypothetical protein
VPLVRSLAKRSLAKRGLAVSILVAAFAAARGVRADQAGDAPPGQPERAAAPAARVELDADDARATLSRHVGTGALFVPYRSRPKIVAQWEDVCLAPCGRDVDTRALYRVDGEGLAPSGSFFLPPGPVRLRAQTGRLVGRAVGVAFTALGASYAPTGAVFLGLSALPGDTRPTFRALGGTFLGLGVVALAVGVPLLVANTTRVTDASGRAVGRPWSLTPLGLVF